MKSLYIHIPFCESKCSYCDFCSFVSNEEIKEQYVKKLCTEIRAKGTSERLYSIFIGGGTPSVLSIKQIEKIINAVQTSFILNENIEISIESNPNSLSIDKLQAYKDLGINRISVGVQSLDNKVLETIGRIHKAEDVYKIAPHLSKYIPNYNFDIMIGLPCQDNISVQQTLNNLIAFDPTHISMYSLILENNTPLFNRVKNKQIVLPNEDEVVEQYELGNQILSSNGYERYEISNFAKNGYECKHNLHYWECGEYIGVGLSAHSYLAGKRFCNTQNMREYLKGDYKPVYVEELTNDEKIEEYIMLSLRTSKGLNLSKLQKELKYDLLIKKQKEIKWLIQNNFIEKQGNFIRILPDKFYVSNAIIEKLI